MTRYRISTAFNLIGYLTLLLALPAVLENMWEVNWLTLTSGPQMIGYVLAHADPDATFVRVVHYSLYASFTFGVIGIISIARLLATGQVDRHQKLFSWLFLVLSAHVLCGALYPYWAPIFDRGAPP